MGLLLMVSATAQTLPITLNGNNPTSKFVVEAPESGCDLTVEMTVFDPDFTDEATFTINNYTTTLFSIAGRSGLERPFPDEPLDGQTVQFSFQVPGAFIIGGQNNVVTLQHVRTAGSRIEAINFIYDCGGDEEPPVASNDSIVGFSGYQLDSIAQWVTNPIKFFGDTLMTMDTTLNPVTVFDTTRNSVTLDDTLRTTTTINDTTIESITVTNIVPVTVRDTTFQDSSVFVYDSTLATLVLTDTLFITITDTFCEPDGPTSVTALFQLGPESNDRLLKDYRDLSSTVGGSNIVSWVWDFGDGTTSTEPNPVNVFPDTDAPISYSVTLTVTDDQGNQDSYTQVISVKQKPPATGEVISLASYVFRVLQDGTKVLYYDGTPSAGASSYQWSESGIDASLQVLNNTSAPAGEVVVNTPNQELPIFSVANGAGVDRLRTEISIRNSNDRAKASFDYSISGRTVTLTDRSVPGELGLASVRYEFTTNQGLIGTASSAPGATTTFTVPDDNSYRILQTVTTGGHPVTGLTDDEQMMIYIGVDQAQAEQPVATFAPNNDGWDASAQPVVFEEIQDNVSTYSWPGTQITAAAFTYNGVAPFLGAPLEDGSGIRFRNRAGQGEVGTQGALSAALFNAPYAYEVTAYIGNPWLGQGVRCGSPTAGFEGAAQRAQTSINGRRRNVEDALAPGETAWTVEALWFTVNDGMNLATDGTRKNPAWGNNNTIEGVTSTDQKYAVSQRIRKIYQGEQTKRTLATNENGPTHSVDIGGDAFWMSVGRPIGESPSSNSEDLIGDYAASGNGFRTDLFWPFNGPSDGESYLLIRAQEYSYNNYVGRDILWFIPVGHLQDLDRGVAPIYDFAQVEHGEQYQNADVFLKTFTFGHYDTRTGGSNKRREATKEAWMGHNQKSMYAHPYIFHHYVKGVGESLPNRASILQSVIDHYGL